jgi:alkanesulfonate monooxygenase SsuD/methylene tetrahydromethanopterin reductase-like flavin-dependent oxidoreductase (luciferase family)
MKFALFYEIPVARPWTPGKEHQAYKNTIEQAVLGEKMGFHAFWTVEHHFLEEYSHCSNPEVLYGAVAALTSTIRIGYGVRLLPKPYNHPIRTAESVAVLDLISDGRVDFGTGRSSTRAELEGFDVDPDETREQWREALGHIVGAWTNDEYQADGKYWRMGAPRRVLPKPMQEPHPPIFGATSSMGGHKEMGRQGIGLCSFTVGLPPEQLADNIAMYREGLAECETPAGKFLNDTAATFTMVHCAPTSEEATDVAKESFEWYPRYGGGLIASVAEWMEERGRTDDLDTYQYTAETLARKREGVMGHITIDYLRDSGSAVMGDPDQCIASAKKYEAVGCDLLLCLVNPLKIPHDKVMQSIELIGKYVLPEFK